jgi:hypothetical protein
MELASPILPAQPLPRCSIHDSEGHEPLRGFWPQVNKPGRNWISCEFFGGCIGGNPANPLLTGSYADDFYRQSLYTLPLQYPRLISTATNSAISSTSGEEHSCQPMTLVRKGDAYVSGGDSCSFGGKSKPQSFVSPLLSATSDSTILCLAGFSRRFPS